MKNKIVTFMEAFLLTLCLTFANCYADGATLISSSNSVKPGQTVEISISLTTDSIGYDIKINATNVESSKVVNKIGDGDTSRIHLVQLVDKDKRVIYPSGTNIATIRYKVSDNLKAGDRVIINVSGNIVGKNSTEKNSLNENLVLNVVEDKKTEENLPTVNEDNKQIENDLPTISGETKQEENNVSAINEGTKTENNNSAINEEIKTESNSTNTSQKQLSTNTGNNSSTQVENKKKTGILPEAGLVVKNYIGYIIAIILVVQATIVIRFIKEK